MIRGTLYYATLPGAFPHARGDDPAMERAKRSVLALLDVLARRERDPQGAEDVRRLAEAVRRAE